MSDNTSLTLRVDLPGAPPREIGDEIWQVDLADAIAEEADAIAYAASAELLGEPTTACQDRLRDRVFAEMSVALLAAGDTYTAPDGTAYALVEQRQLDPGGTKDTLAPMTEAQTAPVVDEVVRFEDLPVGSSATRCVVVRWSDGTEGQALAWYGDEILICEGDLIGKTQQQLRSLHFRRDRDWLQS
jgi:hypothetical protein